MTVICPLCRNEVDTFHGQYVTGPPNGAIHIGHHTAKVFIKDKPKESFYEINCPSSGEILLSPEDM